MPDKSAKILIVDDDQGVLDALAVILESDYQVLTATNGKKAWEKIRSQEIAVALVDLFMPGIDGLKLLSRLKDEAMHTELIMVTGQGSVDTAVEAMRLGAYDYLEKPVDSQRLKQVLAKALEKYRLKASYRAMKRRIDELTHYEELIGQSEAMRNIYEMIDMVAGTDSSVLITGESGTGKELVARALHRRGRNPSGPFVAINCSALPGDILENELFGHEKGAFTGSITEKTGCFELADGGTLFFDEIGEMPFELQAKLLRVLEERSFRRLGGSKEISVNVRIVSATNRDIRQAIAEKSLREDLFYRLAVVEIDMPALRDRIGDLDLLIDDFVQRFAEKNGKRIDGIEREALEILTQYPWPGNVRELRNVIERAVIMTKGEQITVKALPPHLTGVEHTDQVTIPIGVTVAEAEKKLILQTLERHRNNKTRTAEVLGISLKTLHNKLGRYGLKT